MSFQVNREGADQKLLQGSPDRREEAHIQIGALRTTDNLSLYVERRIIDETRPTETRCHYISRRILQGLGSVVASIGKLSFVAISLDYASGNMVLAGFLIYGNLVSFATLICWSALNMIDDYMRPVGEEVKNLVGSKQSTCLKIAILVASVAIGVLAQVPLAYLAYYYNSLKTLMVISVMISDPWFPIYSTNLSLRALADKKSYSPFEKEIVQLKENLKAKLTETQQHLTQISYSERNDWISDLDGIARQAVSQQRSSDYLNCMLSRRVEIMQQSPSCFYKVCEKIIFASGLVFLVCQMIALGVVGFAGWKLIFDNAIFDGIFTGVVVLANLYLSGMTIPGSAVRLFSIVVGLLFCSYQPSLAQKLSPAFSTVATVLGLVTTGLSWGASVQIVKDYFEGWKQDVMMATLPASNVLLVTAAILFVIDGITESKVRRCGSEEEREQMKLKQKCDDFIKTLDKSSVIDFAKFLQNLPRNLLEQISPTAPDIVSRISSELVNVATEDSRLI